MSVREYIGARYVPVIADPIEWDNTRAYEPLTIVTYQGNGYTSRQFVPIGIPINNNTYWAMTSNYNPQIEQYREEVLTFDDRITANTDAITALNGLFPIDTESIAEDAVETTQLANDAITTAKILDANVTTPKIADDAVTTAKILDANVTTPKIADDAVTTAKILDANVTTPKIADNAITFAKLSTQLQCRNNLFITPEEFGAVGNGANDDTQAFKDMLNTIPYDAVIVLRPNARYVISETINITQGQLGIISFAELEYKPAIVFTSDVALGFNVTGFSLSLKNINISGQEYSHEITLMKFDFDSSSLGGNVDAAIANTTFLNARRGIEIFGRNVHISHCLFSAMGDVAIRIAQTQNIVTAMRGYDIEHNRFHECKFCIKNDITNYVDEGCSAKIDSNYADGGNLFYIGTSDNVIITNNYISRTTETYTNLINITRTCKVESMCVVENNSVNATQSATSTYPRCFINVTSDCFGTFVVQGNSFNTKADLQNVNVALFSEHASNKTIVVFKNNVMINRAHASGVYFVGANNMYGVASGNVINGTVGATASSHMTLSDNTNISGGI